MRRILKILLGLSIAAAALVAVAFTLSWLLIDWDERGCDDFPCGVILRDSTGEIMRVTLGPGDTDCRPFYTADKDDWIVKAIVAVEDGEFWSHCGVRPLSIVRAFFQNVFYGRRISGASTLTMQTVRLIHPHPKSYFRKWVEAFEAMKMERRRTKHWILSQYLNRAPFGANFVGIESAAQGWFGKGAKDLGPGEAALLAAMVQAPSRFRPDRGGEAAFKRRDHVLDRMLALGLIDQSQADAARTIRPVVRRINRPFRHPFYCDAFLQGQGSRAKGQGEREGQGSRVKGQGERGEFDVTTPLDPDVQQLCETIVNDAAAGYSVAAVVLRTYDGPLARRPQPSPSHPITASPSHQLIALACSGDYFSQDGGQVNTALAPRPAGSTLKPFLVAQAVELGIVTPSMRLDDAPITYKGYRPANFDSAYRGPVTVRDALILSLNIPFVRLLERVGLARFASRLRSLGLSHMTEPDDKFGLGMAIGNVEVSLLELTQAYANAFVPPPLPQDDPLSANSTVLKFYNVNSTIPEFQNSTIPQFHNSAFLVSEMLSGAERASAALGHIADVRSLPRFAWKTGTSSGYRDAWCILWNPEFVIGVWCGHKRGGFGDKSLVGAIAAAPPAWRIARALYPQGDGPWFAKPAAIASRRVCSVTGLVASDDCRETEDADFIRGVSSPAICAACSRSAAAPDAPATRTITITRPENGAVFTIVKGLAQQRIVCETLGNAPDTPLWWFIDGVPAGRTTGSQRFSFPPTPGEHTITCADPAGASASVSFSVRE